MITYEMRKRYAPHQWWFTMWIFTAHLCATLWQIHVQHSRKYMCTPAMVHPMIGPLQVHILCFFILLLTCGAPPCQFAQRTCAPHSLKYLCQTFSLTTFGGICENISNVEHFWAFAANMRVLPQNASCSKYRKK